jgi:hypothetical protein
MLLEEGTMSSKRILSEDILINYLLKSSLNEFSFKGEEDDTIELF